MKRKTTLELRCEYSDDELAFKRDELSTVIVHQGAVGEKTIIRLDTGEQVRVEPMTEDERQEEIEFDVSEAHDDIKSLIDSASDAPLPPPPLPPDEPPELEASGD
jgi:hypothetical protein